MRLWGYKYAKYLIRNYRMRGFQIRFPGGTSWNGELNSLVIAIEFNLQGKIFFVVIPYDPKSNLEREQKTKKETPKLLAQRKLREETGLSALASDFVLIMKMIVNNNLLNDNSKHTKYFFVIEKFSGKFLDLSNSSFLNRETATPFMVPGPLLAQTIFYGHIPAFKYAISYFSSRLDKKDLDLINIALNKRETILKGFKK
jgi:hypothetical protein